MRKERREEHVKREGPCGREDVRKEREKLREKLEKKREERKRDTQDERYNK